MEDSKHTTAGNATAYDIDEKRGHDDVELQPASRTLTRALQGRHMQMIAIGMYLYFIQALPSRS